MQNSLNRSTRKIGLSFKINLALLAVLVVTFTALTIVVILSVIEELNLISREVKKAVDDISRGTGEINRAVENIRLMSAENNRQIKQVAGDASRFRIGRTDCPDPGE